MIPLEVLGLRRDKDDIISGGDLQPLTPGAEACPYLDQDQQVVYKLFFLRDNGTLGTYFELSQKNEDDDPGVPAEDLYFVETKQATLVNTLHKLAFPNSAGAHPTEIVGLTEQGDFLMAKQPRAFQVPAGGFKQAQARAVELMKGLPVRARLDKGVVALWSKGEELLMTDLHEGNVMIDHEGNPTIIDALTGSVSPRALL